MKLSALERAGQAVVLPDRALQCRLCVPGATGEICAGCHEQARRLQWTIDELVSATVRQRLVGSGRADVCLSRARQVGLL